MSINAGDRIIYNNDGMLTIGRVLSNAKLGTVAIAAKGKSKWIPAAAIVLAQRERKKRGGHAVVGLSDGWLPVA